MTLVVVLLTVVAVTAWAGRLWRTLASGGSGVVRPPQPPQRHWSGVGRALPDAPYRSLDRIA